MSTQHNKKYLGKVLVLHASVQVAGVFSLQSDGSTTSSTNDDSNKFSATGTQLTDRHYAYRFPGCEIEERYSKLRASYKKEYIKRGFEIGQMVQVSDDESILHEAVITSFKDKDPLCKRTTGCGSQSSLPWNFVENDLIFPMEKSIYGPITPQKILDARRNDIEKVMSRIDNLGVITKENCDAAKFDFFTVVREEAHVYNYDFGKCTIGLRYNQFRASYDQIYKDTNHSFCNDLQGDERPCVTFPTEDFPKGLSLNVSAHHNMSLERFFKDRKGKMEKLLERIHASGLIHAGNCNHAQQNFFGAVHDEAAKKTTAHPLSFYKADPEFQRPRADLSV